MENALLCSNLCVCAMSTKTPNYSLCTLVLFFFRCCYCCHCLCFCCAPLVRSFSPSRMVLKCEHHSKYQHRQISTFTYIDKKIVCVFKILEFRISNRTKSNNSLSQMTFFVVFASNFIQDTPILFFSELKIFTIRFLKIIFTTK